MAEVVISGIMEHLSRIAQLKLTGRDVKDAVEKISSNLGALQPMLFDADQVVGEAVRQWVNKVEDFCYEMDIVLDSERTAVLRSRIEKEEGEDEDEDEVDLPSGKVCIFMPSSCFVLVQFHRVVLQYDIARKKMELNKKLVEIDTDRKKCTFEKRANTEMEFGRTASTSLPDESGVRGRDDEKEILLSKLLNQSSKDGRCLEIIPIVGMGGIGKTTLAQLAYNDEDIKKHFELRIWVGVGYTFDLFRIAKKIIEAITGSISALSELESVLTCISYSIEKKRFLLVLDDVWTEDWTKWEPLEGVLRDGDESSRILVTTRSTKVAAMMRATTNMVHLEMLSEESCWGIFQKHAFSENDWEKRDQFEEFRIEIVKKCGGLPFVAKALGGLMRCKHEKEEWTSVLHHQLWELSDVRPNVFGPLLLSYYNFSPLQKHCLLLCSLFPADFWTDKNDLIELWMSQGYLDGNKSFEEGENVFKSLVTQSILQIFKENLYEYFTSCWMNVVMHEAVRFVARNKRFMLEDVSSDESSTIKESEAITHHCNLLLKSGVQIPISVYRKKKLRTLVVMRSETSRPLNLDLLTLLTCLYTLCLAGCNVEKLPRRIDKLIHLRYLNLSNNPNLKELPYRLCNLLNLQTLRLNGCTDLQCLPKQMGRLVNLQHLYIYGCDCLEELPKRIGRLTSLRILDEFIITQKSLSNRSAMKLEDLNKLRHLQGRLCISGIGNLEDAGDAEKAQLRDKQNVSDLVLDFAGNFSRPEGGKTDMKSLDYLQPPPDLKSLGIRKYSGTTFPEWMVLLVNLRRLVLSDCHNCELLPAFGELPSLQILHIINMDNLEKVDSEFLQLRSDSEPFPKLRELRFVRLPKWKEWSAKIEQYSSSLMPTLESLEIAYCESLHTIPDFLKTLPALQKLIITGWPNLEGKSLGPESCSTIIKKAPF